MVCILLGGIVVWENVAFFSRRRACQEFLTNLGVFGQGFLTKTLFIVLGAEVEYETIGAIQFAAGCSLVVVRLIFVSVWRC
jgi:hypothetical protein